MGNRWCVRIICITLGILFKNTSKVEGSKGCPESQSLDLGNSFQNVSWDTTWSDYQSKTCSWRLNFQTPDIVEFTLRLEKLILSSHDAFVYSNMGIVKERMKDKIQMEVCGDGDKTELSATPTGQEFHRMGSAVCFFIPHAGYNFGQNIFTTHFINMEISVKRNLLGTEKLGSTTRSFEETPNNNPSTAFIRGTDFLKTRLTTVKAITTTMASSSDSHPGIEYTSLPVRLTSNSPYLNKISNITSSFTISSPLNPQSVPHISPGPQVMNFSHTSHYSTNNAQSSQQPTIYLSLNSKLTTSLIRNQESINSSLSHQHTSTPSLSSQSTDFPFSVKLSTPFVQYSTSHKELSTNAPSTHKLSTNVPSTHKLSTNAPSTHKLSTNAPSTHKLFTNAPSTHKLSTNAPSTHKLSTNAPSTHKLSTNAPSSHKLSTYAPLSHQPSSSHPFTDRELFSSKLSTHFSRTSGTIFNPLSTVSMATPWTLTVRTTETTLVFGTTRSNDPAVNTFAGDPTDEKSNVYLIAGVVSGTVVILLLMILVVVFILRTRRRNEEDTSVYRLSYSQPWPWRKNWVITRSFNEIEAERAKAEELQHKPVLPFRPSLKRFPEAPSQDTVSESLDAEENGVYDNILAL